MGSAGWRQAGQLVSRSSTRAAHTPRSTARGRKRPFRWPWHLALLAVSKFLFSWACHTHATRRLWLPNFARPPDPPLSSPFRYFALGGALWTKHGYARKRERCVCACHCMMYTVHCVTSVSRGRGKALSCSLPSLKVHHLSPAQELAMPHCVRWRLHGVHRSHRVARMGPAVLDAVPASRPRRRR